MKQSRRNMRTVCVAGAVLVWGLGLAGCTPGGEDSREVPEAVSVVEGERSGVSSANDVNWSFSVEVADESAQRESVTRLTDAGFRILGEQESDAGELISLTSEADSLNVTLLLGERDGAPLVIYNIVQL